MSNKIEDVYLMSPLWLQQIMASIYGYWWFKRRYNKHFHKLYQGFIDSEYWDVEQFDLYKRNQLIKILEAALNTTYYKEILPKFNVDDYINPIDSLLELPLLSKETLRVRAEDLLVQGKLPKDVSIYKTSGTTGTPTQIYYSPLFHALELAVPAARNFKWANINYNERRVMFGVRKVCHYSQDKPPFWRFSPKKNLAYLSVYHLSPKYMPDYIRFLRDFKPAIIMGYPSALNTIAQFALENNLLPIPAKGVFTTSETVTYPMRRAIEDAWGCKIYDRYGAVEGCFFASQCEYGRYHVSPEVGIIEILDINNQPCPPGVTGEVVVTGLQNTLQPLIRYRIGDAARWAVNQICSCGRQMPILEAVEGRFEDLCITPDGRAMLRFDAIFKGVDNVKEAQVVQESLSKFIIKIVPGKRYTEEDENKLVRNMKLHVGELDIVVNVVSEIPRTTSGKFKAVVCNVMSKRLLVQSY